MLIKSHPLMMQHHASAGSIRPSKAVTANAKQLKRFYLFIMLRFAVAAAFAILALASGQLPCSSQLRLIYPQFFTHCDCHYSEWGEWVVDAASLVTVPTAQCTSGQALNETKTQGATGLNCMDKTETRTICKCMYVSTLWRF